MERIPTLSGGEKGMLVQCSRLGGQVGGKTRENKFNGKGGDPQGFFVCVCAGSGGNERAVERMPSSRIIKESDLDGD
jgi:hypothetical protein